jgi:hypothetical protein
LLALTFSNNNGQEMLSLMRDVYKRAFYQLELDDKPTAEGQRLASCILNIGKSVRDPQMLFVETIRSYAAGKKFESEIEPLRLIVSFLK